jgi:polysaccharide deacetylase family protein (PEP-CTERM system associated)
MMTTYTGPNALTIDVEDYFHVTTFFDPSSGPSKWSKIASRVERNTDRLLEILSAAKVKASFLVLGWIAENFPGLLARIDAEGHEVGTHGYAHEVVYRTSPEEFRDRLRRSMDAIEAVTGKKVESHRSAFFSITRQSLWALDTMAGLGVKYDSSIFPVRHDRYGISDAPLGPYWVRGDLLELPPSACNFMGGRLPVAGGGYFRFFPYAFTRARFHQIRAEGRPVVFYLHPWEIDPAQPPIEASWPRRFRHRLNLGATEPRLRRLLRDFEFAPLAEVAKALVSAKGHARRAELTLGHEGAA